MPLPKKIKKNIPLTESKILLERRQELVDKINQDGTYLPKSLLHADLDGGFLDFVKNELRLVVDGKVVPNVDILMTTQNWAQFTQTWDFQNIDKNAEPPFITVVRTPEVKYGTNPATLYTIPNRRQFFYAQVPTWDGNRVGMDIYTIPQPVPIDITYQVKIICNRMRELNAFNKVVIEKFSSIQAYQVIKGHYIPIKMNNITDESVMDMEKRKYYIQSYEFVMLGFLIDENEFEVSPAITRSLQVFETDTRSIKRGKRNEIPNDSVEINSVFKVGVDSLSERFDYITNLTIDTTTNIDSYDIYINNDYYGSDINTIELNSGDTIRIDIVKVDTLSESTIRIISKLL
jgi:hypothetical protein